MLSHMLKIEKEPHVEIEFETVDIPQARPHSKAKYADLWNALETNRGKAQRLLGVDPRQAAAIAMALRKRATFKGLKIHTRSLPDGTYMWIDATKD